MKRSTERILTTHTGSLARPPELLQMLVAREEGKPVDPGVFDATVRGAVLEKVKRQVEVGLAVVNDGEQSKISFATYVRERLHGFGGTDEPRPVGPKAEQRERAGLDSVDEPEAESRAADVRRAGPRATA